MLTRPLPMPFNPFSPEQHRERYQSALVEVFDVESIEFSGARRPGETPANVFDFFDGLRIVVSRDRMPDGEVLLHVSASAKHDSRLYRDLLKHRVTMLAFFDLVESRWRAMSGSTVKLELAGLSEGKGVPHWFAVDTGRESV